MRDSEVFSRRRRDWFKGVALAGALMPLAPRQARAQRKQAHGLVMSKGEVRINGRVAAMGTQVKAGDSVATAAGGVAVFVVGADAFLLRENSELRTSGENELIAALRLVTGKLLSVFGKGRRTITTATATIGIRGTGIYVEVETDRTYVCTCYGVVDLQANDMPAARETVRTMHHDAPRYIYAHGEMPIQMIRQAPVLNHSDAELIMLEALVGREPPFVGAGIQYQDY